MYRYRLTQRVTLASAGNTLRVPLITWRSVYLTWNDGGRIGRSEESNEEDW
jgi:hypothetical protein